jgi:hypothetical protein
MSIGVSTVSRGGDRRPIRPRNVVGSRGRKIIPASFPGLCRDSAPGRSRTLILFLNGASKSRQETTHFYSRHFFKMILIRLPL